MAKPKLLVFAQGTSTGGGSGFEKLVFESRTPAGALDADIVGVVSNHKQGGVWKRAQTLGVPFYHFGRPWSGFGYVLPFIESGAEFVACSGWLKLVIALDPRITFNIHPGPLKTFGGPGMYGHHVHESVIDAYRLGEVTHSAVCMHFVTKKFDDGPCFFRRRVKIRPEDTPETLATRVNAVEHRWQPSITNLVVHREITWDGKDPQSLKVPQGYHIISDEED